MDVTVRLSTPDDFDEVFALWEAVAGEGRWLGTELPMDREQRRKGFESHIARDDAASFVAVLDGRIVGSLGIELAPYQVAGLGMCVAEDVRGRGVGSALLAAAIEFAREVGAHKVELQMWPHNERGRALYEKFGFVEEGLLRRHYRRRNGELWDAVQMGLVLDETSPGSPWSSSSVSSS